MVLDERNIPSVEGDRPKRRMTLESRLKALAKSDFELAELLRAIKWIGNDGSHSAEVTRNDVLEVAEILEVALAALYEDKTRQQAIRQRVARINSSKGVDGLRLEDAKDPTAVT